MPLHDPKLFSVCYYCIRLWRAVLTNYLIKTVFVITIMTVFTYSGWHLSSRWRFNGKLIKNDGTVSQRWVVGCGDSVSGSLYRSRVSTRTNRSRSEFKSEIGSPAHLKFWYVLVLGKLHKPSERSAAWASFHSVTTSKLNLLIFLDMSSKYEHGEITFNLYK